MHKTAAWPLTLIYAGLVVYASLYPFADWRDQGVAPWAFLSAPWPRYWTGFDVGVNVVGYLPLGGLLALSALRRGRIPYPLVWAVFAASLVSLLMESLQNYLPARVPSREDWLLNMAGACLGAGMTVVLERLGAIQRWSQWRARWLVPRARGGLVLLATWPVALLFPSSVPLGLGQVLERLQAWAMGIWEQTPWQQWLPVREAVLQPLVPSAECLCVVLGFLVPCLVGYCIIPSVWRRIVFIAMALLAAVSVSALSAALSWGPLHAWAWLDAPAQWGLVLGLGLTLALVRVPARAGAALALLALGVYLSLLNQAPESPYFAQTLQDWEQGRFIRFHGLAQWVGWLWPYAAMVYAFTQVWQRDPPA